MSELNLNEPVTETVRDAQVITVEIDSTLTVSGEAADAKAVGDALALKADASSITAIDVNGESADNQGHIIIDAEDVKMSSSDTRTIKAAVDAAAGRTGADIPMSSTDATKVNAAVTALQGKTAANIPMSDEAGADSIATAVGAISETVGEHTTAIEALEDKAADTILMEADGEETVKAAIEARVQSVNGVLPDENGAVVIASVPAADNLNSTLNQTNTGKFVFRTTGGAASVKAGSASLNVIRGDRTHTGFSPQSVEMAVNGDNITATIDEDAFIAAMDSATGTKTFSYTSSWSDDPGDYGITVSGTPENGDSIVVAYAKEVRGTITQSDPQSFVSTGWNLYNHALGYAKVKKYSDIYGFCIGGSWTQIKYSATLNGDKSAITPSAAGRFSILADGYIWVTGGDSTTTQIWMTWEDWTAQANGGIFDPYSETVIDLTSLMGTRFPYGLLRAGSVRDEINLGAGNAYSRVERWTYSEANKATAKASGLEYEYDEDYIYIAKSSQNIYDISIASSFTANDHGEEYFTGTDEGPEATISYLVNLANKLERDTLTISRQNLTDAQKDGVLEYIGAKDEIDSRIGAATTDAIIFRAYSGTYSNTAGGSVQVNATALGIQPIEGYTPMAIVSITTGNNANVIYAMYPKTDGTIVSIRNVNNTAYSNRTLKLTMAFVKNSMT